MQQELNDTRARLAAGDVITLVTRVDTPQTGPYPEGPGRSMIAAAAVVGGLLVGLGLVVLTMPAPVRPPMAIQAHAAGSSAPATTVPSPPSPTAQSAGATVQEEQDSHHHMADSYVHATPEPTQKRIPARAPTSFTGNAPSGRPARSMTLKEALIRCNDLANPWK